MTQELSEKILTVLLDISKNFDLIPFWRDWDFWSFVALAGTLFFLIRYTRATEKIAKYQMMPTIDVNMCYDTTARKTYFWFSNHSSLAGFVHLKSQKNNSEKKAVYHPLRIAPKEKAKKTATTFDFSPAEGDELVLHISISSSLEKSDIKFEFKKAYKFSNNQWKEASWNFPDPLFPV